MGSLLRRGTAAALLCALTAPGALAQAPATGRTDWLVLPLLTYNSDDLLSYGAALQVQFHGRPVKPYSAQIGAQALFSTAGVQSHFLRFDMPRLFGTDLRLWVSGQYHRERFSPYYGLGNGSSQALADHPGLFGDHPFAYERTFPLGSLVLSLPLGGSRVRISAGVRYVRLRTVLFPGSLLDQDRPPGTFGGESLAGQFGVYLDRRDDEDVPSRGFLVEGALRGAVTGVGSSSGFAGGTGRVLLFLPVVGRRFVLALRGEADALTPGAPLFELSRFGGFEPMDGVGGAGSVRGVPRNRYIGLVKVVGNAELRVYMGDARALGQSFSYGAVAFVDTGRVFQLDGHDGPFNRFHPGAGGGLRLWRRAFVLRIDGGTSSERSFSFYALFGNIF